MPKDDSVLFLGMELPVPKLTDPADQSVFMALAGLTSVAEAPHFRGTND